MMKAYPKPKSNRKSSGGGLAVFTTLLVVLGVAGTVWVMSQAPVKPSSPTQAPPPSAAAAKASPAFLIADGSGSRIISGMKVIPMSASDTSLLGQPAANLVGEDVMNGEEAFLSDALSRATTTGFLRSPDGIRSTHIGATKPDGTGSIDIQSGSGSQTVTLRLANGNGLKESSVIGWWDNATIAVAGRATDARQVFAVSISGKVTPIAVLPDNVQRVHADNGWVWYTTLTPGQGLENPPQPPSELHRVTLDGKDENVITDTAHVIAYDVAYRDATVVYGTDDGMMHAITDPTKPPLEIGEGVPLFMVDDTKLVYRLKMELYLKNIVTGQDTLISRISRTDSAVFYLPSALVDATSTTK